MASSKKKNKQDGSILQPVEAETPDSADDGITGISVRGYKSIAKKCDVEIKPLTLLAGANSSGKSSLMQPLLLLKQTLEATYDPGALLLNGSNVTFSDAEQVFSNIPGKSRGTSFDLGLRASHEKLKLVFEESEGEAFHIPEMVCSPPKGEVMPFRSGVSHEEILKWLPSHIDELRSSVFKDIQPNLRWEIARTRCFLGVRLCSGRKEVSESFLAPFVSPTGVYERAARELIHVPGLRGNPERSYPTTPIGRAFPGTFEHYVASVINHWQTKQDPRLEQLIEALSELQLTGNIQAVRIDDTHVKLQVGQLLNGKGSKTAHLVNIADVGFGVSQILPVLVSLLVAKPGQLVYLEQPEIHLHPRAQAALASILVDAANRGVRVVAETHSSLLLLAIQTQVAREKLPVDRVRLHWFTRRPSDGTTEITSAKLDSEGAFGDWPEDFADVALDVESQYLDATAR